MLCGVQRATCSLRHNPRHCLNASELFEIAATTRDECRHSGKDSLPRLQFATRVPSLWVAAGVACCMEEVHLVILVFVDGRKKGRGWVQKED